MSIRKFFERPDGPGNFEDGAGFPGDHLGEEFSGDVHVKRMGHSFGEMVSLFGEIMDVRPQGYAVDKKFPEIV